jgi:hypothetical protein
LGYIARAVSVLDAMKMQQGGSDYTLTPEVKSRSTDHDPMEEIKWIRWEEILHQQLKRPGDLKITEPFKWSS